MAAGSLRGGLTCQCEEKAPGHSLHDTAAEQGCRGEGRAEVRQPGPAPGSQCLGHRARAQIPRVHLVYEVVWGKLLISVSSLLFT